MAWTRSDIKRSCPCNGVLLCFLRERKGWTQAELARVAGYSERLINKAEAGQPISSDAINDLADALSSADSPVYPEDVISDPVKMAQDYIAALYIHQKEIVNAIRHFLDDDIIIRLPGDPQIIPFAGEHRGIAAVERVFEIFYSILEAPADHDHTSCYTYVGQGNEVIVWGESWIHPIGAPMTEPMRLVHRMQFRRGKLLQVEVVYDSLHGKNVLNPHMKSGVDFEEARKTLFAKSNGTAQDE
jgi:transcriptional regulator with XRE-family HTH domain